MSGEDVKKDDGGPAFPSHGTMGEVAQHGMSLRDWFAGQALTGLLAEAAHPKSLGSWSQLQDFARKAYEAADAMIKEKSHAR